MSDAAEISKINETESAEPLVADLLAAVVAQDRGRFDRLVEALMPVGEIASPALVEQARQNASARADFLQEFPTLSSADVAALYGSTASNRAALAQSWRKQGRIFAVPVANGHRFPAFQFTSAGEPRPAIAAILEPLRAAGLSGWQLALWFTGALASLDDRRPIDLLDSDADRVREAAGRVGEVPQ